ncbi:hypothetical protein O181_062339 [Austropuccinia psidii MF-1]|uniref:Integrase catalytic domain-containing protein n=1 Tax=Austropuccinia psidii MF-1 TaxID=1389203 RepID=A0A9Q3I1G9_9BASI|nr:hypothetical protein [Austropuccinia psidii MF-1]
MDLPPSYHDSLEELWDEEEDPEEVETVMSIVPSVYHQYLDVFSKVKAVKLPPHCACDHHIELEGSLPQVGVIYFVSNQQSDTLRAYISENVEKVFIWPSSSSTGEPVLFVKKEGWWPLIKEGDEHLTDFRTKYGSYEYLIMSFGLTNAPASFQNLVNDILQDILDGFFVVYLDDIMVFSKSEEEHVTHVSTVLTRLRAPNLFSKPSKCLFHVTSVEYLGYVVSSEGLKMDQAKVQQTLNWPPARNLKDIQSFLGFAKFDCHLIKNDSKKISPLTSFLKKDSCFPLNEQALSHFHQLKEGFTTAPILCSRNKNIHHKKFGLLKPLPIPNGPWICLSLEFITQLPLSNSFELILVIVERFSKMAVFISTICSITSLDLAHSFIRNIFSKHGLPSSIVSDRGSVFVYSFWSNLCQQLKISRDWSASDHPETDGQTERANQILEQYLWMYVSYHQYYWNTWLPLSEFAYNNSDHSSTKQSPFSLFMEEIHNLTQFTLLKILLLESYQQNSNQYSKMSRENSKFP